MRRHPVCWLLPATLAWATATAMAQGTPSSQSTAPRADPLDATANVPPLVYTPTLAAYQRLGEIEPLAWRDANDQVGRIGGWRAYAREANAPDTPAGTAPAPQPAAKAASVPLSMPMSMPISKPMSKPKPGAHDGHKMP